METINHEYYVSLEVAKLFKEAGFDWKVISYYRNRNDRIQFGEEPIDWNRQHSQLTIANDYSAPTLDVAQRWLREVKEYDINVLTDFDSVKRLYCVRYIVKDGHYKTYYITDNQSYTYYNTYEEAQEAGIKKCLEEDCITDKCSEE